VGGALYSLAHLVLALEPERRESGEVYKCPPGHTIISPWRWPLLDPTDVKATKPDAPTHKPLDLVLHHSLDQREYLITKEGDPSERECHAE
jgi:hypothetical protein